MKSVFVLAVLAASAVAQSFQVNTPSGATGAIQCQVYQITWTGGTGPFDLRVNNAGNTLVEELGSSIPSSPFAWTVNQPSGQQFAFVVLDSQGNTALSGPFVVEQSSNSACLTVTPSASSGGSATAAPSGSTPAGSSGSTPTASSGSSSSGSSGASSRPSSSGTASAAGSASSSTNSPSSAMNNVASAGFLGAVFAAAAALF